MKRRAFLEASAGSALALTVPTPRCHSLVRFLASNRLANPPADLITLRDPQVKALALLALESARSAGAGYADVRLTYTTRRSFSSRAPSSTELQLGLSVRALVNGYWGWAATPYLSESEGPRVGRDAALLARANTTNGRPRPVEWGSNPPVTEGTWSTPLARDPFTVAPAEVSDWLAGTVALIDGLTTFHGGDVGASATAEFIKQERIFASTEGSYLFQTIFTRELGLGFDHRGVRGRLDLPRAQGGWEDLAGLPIEALVQQEMTRIEQLPHLPHRHNLEVGRYDLICTAPTVAPILAQTFGLATQLDRALGYEANAGGTSYLGPDPLTQLGTAVAAPFVTVTADRSSPKGLATVHWDDDGVTPADFPIVQDGVLVDYQTTRELTAPLAPWYQRHGRPVRSQGCLASRDALAYPMLQTPNLTLHPGPHAADVPELIASLEHGLLVDGIGLEMDFQCLNGQGNVGGQYGKLYEVRHGKLVAEYDKEMYKVLLFRTPELWRNILALGGPASAQVGVPAYSSKGEPAEETWSSLSVVPAVFQQVTVVNPPGH